MSIWKSRIFFLHAFVRIDFVIVFDTRIILVWFFFEYDLTNNNKERSNRLPEICLLSLISALPGFYNNRPDCQVCYFWDRSKKKMAPFKASGPQSMSWSGWLFVVLINIHNKWKEKKVEVGLQHGKGWGLIFQRGCWTVCVVLSQMLSSWLLFVQVDPTWVKILAESYVYVLQPHPFCASLFLAAVIFFLLLSSSKSVE